MEVIRRKRKGLALLYCVALLSLSLTAVVSAEWQYGCCEDATSECGGTLHCHPKNESDCYCNWLYCEENYCWPSHVQ